MMSASEYRYVNKNIRKLIKGRKLCKQTKLILFGISDNTRQMIKMIRDYGYEPDCVIENDKRKWNTIFMGLHVYSVEERLNPYDKDIVVLINSFYYTEMCAQIAKYGYGSRQVLNCHSKWRNSETFRIISILKGAMYYHKIRAKYNNIKILICPYTGVGDIYLIGTFLNEWLSVNNIDDYVFLVVNKACSKVCKIFTIKNVENIGLEKSSNLLDANFFAPDLFPLHILNDSFPTYAKNTDQVQRIRGYKGLNFTDMFRIGVFDLPKESKPQLPELRITDDAKKFVLEHNISDDVILISPYANTVGELPKEFWIKLVRNLKEMGYRVFTNSGGTNEPVIEGTESLFFSLDIAAQVACFMKGIIGVRSGFMDVISGARCVKIVLYDDNYYFYAGKSFDYFSLNRMGLCRDAVEICYDTSSEAEKIIDSIQQYF